MQSSELEISDPLASAPADARVKGGEPLGSCESIEWKPRFS